MNELALKNTSNTTRRIHPQVFALWMGFLSIIMMFIALTSAYIVKQAAGNWLEFIIPNSFYFSTAVILISSLTLHLSYSSFKKGKEFLYKSMLVVSLILGCVFVVLQYKGWFQLFDGGVDMKGNPSGSFFYLITGLHAVHILGGIAALIVALLHAFTLPFKPTERRRVRFSLVLQYWHFVDILWIYLFTFLLFI